ncbi:MAG: thiamine phosphate synthase [Myxococcota bacterium]
MTPLPLGLYGMADAQFGDPITIGVDLADAGCEVIQLRAKGWEESALLDVAGRMKEALHARGCRLIINDNPIVASRCGADGVHLGQDDGDINVVRALLGPSVWIGRSTHTLEQVEQAQTEADYIGFGPIFSTQTKRTGYAERGVEMLKDAITRSQIPVVAIGGITPARLPDIKHAGAKHWAVISAILRAPDRIAATRALLGRE